MMPYICCWPECVRGHTLEDCPLNKQETKILTTEEIEAEMQRLKKETGELLLKIAKNELYKETKMTRKEAIEKLNKGLLCGNEDYNIRFIERLEKLGLISFKEENQYLMLKTANGEQHKVLISEVQLML